MAASNSEIHICGDSETVTQREHKNLPAPEAGQVESKAGEVETVENRHTEESGPNTGSCQSLSKFPSEEGGSKVIESSDDHSTEYSVSEVSCAELRPVGQNSNEKLTESSNEELYIIGSESVDTGLSFDKEKQPTPSEYTNDAGAENNGNLAITTKGGDSVNIMEGKDDTGMPPVTTVVGKQMEAEGESKENFGARTELLENQTVSKVSCSVQDSEDVCLSERNSCESPRNNLVTELQDDLQHSPTTVASSEFQPVILDVRSCADTGDGEDTLNPVSCNIPETDNRKTDDKVTSDSGVGEVAQTMESIPKSAFELLQGMMHTVQPPGNTLSAPIFATPNMSSATKTPSLTSLLSLAKRTVQAEKSKISAKKAVQIEKSKTSEGGISVAVSGHQDTTTVSSCLVAHTSSSATGTAASSSGTVTAASNEAGAQISQTLPLVTSSQSISNIRSILTSTPVSQIQCVLVQKTSDSGMGGRVTLIIPPSTSSKNTLCSSVGLISSQSTGNKTKMSNVSSLASLSSQAPCDSSDTPMMSVEERINGMFSRVVNNFKVSHKNYTSKWNLLSHSTQSQSELNEFAFPCFICGQGFYFEDGYNFHLQRPVFNLTYYCSHCVKGKVFHNKCTLWLHLESHCSTPTLSHSHIVELLPYDFEKESAQEISMAKTVETSANNSGARNSSASVCSASSTVTTGQTVSSQTKTSTVVSAQGSRVSAVPDQSVTGQFTGDTNISDGFSPNESPERAMCPSCLQFVPDLTDHLFRPTLGKYICYKCEMFLPTKCAVQGHLKIHEGRLHCMWCPECGKKRFQTGGMKDGLKAVFDHLDSCNHFNRRLILKCQCRQEFASVKQMCSHIVESHVKLLFRCPQCTVAFSNYSLFEKHHKMIHHKNDLSVQSLVVCMLCPKRLNSVAELKNHVEIHAEDYKLNGTFKWKCFICVKTFVDKKSLNSHAEEGHPHKAKRCTVCFSLFCSRKALVDHLILAKCMRALPDILDRCVDIVDLSEAADVNYQQFFDRHSSLPSSCTVVSLSGAVATSSSCAMAAPSLCTSSSCAMAAPSSCTSSGAMAAPSSCTTETTPSSCTVVTPSLVISSEKIGCKSVSQASAVRSVAVRLKFPLKPHQSLHPRDMSKHQCHICKIIIVGKSNYDSHLKLHALRGKVISEDVTRCVVCRKAITNFGIISHLKAHQSEGIIICCKCQRRDFKSMAEAIEHGRNMCNYRTIKGFGDLDMLESLETQVSSEERIGNEGTEIDLDNREGSNEEEIETGQSTMFPCLMCGLTFQSLPSRDEHVSRWHQGTRTVYNCAFCKKRGKGRSFSRKEFVVKHINKKHRVVDASAVEKLVKIEEQTVSGGQKVPQGTPAPNGNDEATPPKRLRIASEGDYLCGKCAFSCSESEEFLEHISSHNPNKEPQCPECGLCFTVLPALKRHLFAVHKIKAVDEYLKDKAISEPEVDEEESVDSLSDIDPYIGITTRPEELDEESSMDSIVVSNNPLECNVCYKVFESELNLRTHMRNHGMAFIRSRRYKT